MRNLIASSPDAGPGACAREGQADARTSAQPNAAPPTVTMIFFVRCSMAPLYVRNLMFREDRAQPPARRRLGEAIGRRRNFFCRRERGLQRRVELAVAALLRELVVRERARRVDGEADLRR